MLELEDHNNADDNFTENMINVLNLAANAHKTFNLSKIGKKRQLINLVLSTKKLNGHKLEFTLRSPFDAFVKIGKNGEWRTLVYDFRTFYKLLIMVIKHPNQAINA